jgi:hypothetical protein
MTIPTSWYVPSTGQQVKEKNGAGSPGLSSDVQCLNPLAAVGYDALPCSADPRISCCWWPLIVITFFLFLVSIEEKFPHDDDVCITWSETLDRQALGYTKLPSYDPQRRSFDMWNGDDWVGRFGSRYWADYPHWPGGDPGLGDNNPLPSQVIRYHIDGLHMELFLLIPASLWAAWSLLYARHLLWGPARGRGFDISTHYAPPRPEAGAEAPSP